MVGSYQAGSLPFPGSERSLSRAGTGLGFGWVGDLTVAQGKPLQPQHGGRGSCLGGHAVDPGPQGPTLCAVAGEQEGAPAQAAHAVCKHRSSQSREQNVARLSSYLDKYTLLMTWRPTFEFRTMGPLSAVLPP